MSKVAVVAKLTAAPGKRDELIDVFKGLFDAVEAEAGTEIYSLHTDTGDADTVWFFEFYRDNDALAAHGGSDAMKALGPKLAGLLGGAPDLRVLAPVVAKGLAL
jgi:quinol monooxygenase YgiN